MPHRIEKEDPSLTPRNIDAFIDDHASPFFYINRIEMSDMLAHESLSIWVVRSH